MSDEDTQVLPPPPAPRMVYTIIRGFSFYRAPGAACALAWMPGACHTCKEAVTVCAHLLKEPDDLVLLASGLKRALPPPKTGHIVEAGGHSYCAECLANALARLLSDVTPDPDATATITPIAQGLSYE